MKKLSLKNDPSAGMNNWAVKFVPRLKEAMPHYEYCKNEKDLKDCLKDAKSWFLGDIYVYRVTYDFRECYRL